MVGATAVTPPPRRPPAVLARNCAVGPPPAHWAMSPPAVEPTPPPAPIAELRVAVGKEGSPPIRVRAKFGARPAALKAPPTPMPVTAPAVPAPAPYKRRSISSLGTVSPTTLVMPFWIFSDPSQGLVTGAMTSLPARVLMPPTALFPSQAERSNTPPAILANSALAPDAKLPARWLKPPLGTRSSKAPWREGVPCGIRSSKAPIKVPQHRHLGFATVG